MDRSVEKTQKKKNYMYAILYKKRKSLNTNRFNKQKRCAFLFLFIYFFVFFAPLFLHGFADRTAVGHAGGDEWGDGAGGRSLNVLDGQAFFFYAQSAFISSPAKRTRSSSSSSSSCD